MLGKHDYTKSCEESFAGRNNEDKRHANSLSALTNCTVNSTNQSPVRSVQRRTVCGSDTRSAIAYRVQFTQQLTYKTTCKNTDTGSEVAIWRMAWRNIVEFRGVAPGGI